MKVLISGPNIYDARVYLPTTFLNLKTYIECQTDIKNVQWLDPLFRNRPLEQMVAGRTFFLQPITYPANSGDWICEACKANPSKRNVHHSA